MMENLSKSVAGKANELIEDGNPLLAERMMMNYLPDSTSPQSTCAKPYPIATSTAHLGAMRLW